MFFLRRCVTASKSKFLQKRMSVPGTCSRYFKSLVEYVVPIFLTYTLKFDLGTFTQKVTFPCVFRGPLWNRRCGTRLPCWPGERCDAPPYSPSDCENELNLRGHQGNFNGRCTTIRQPHGYVHNSSLIFCSLNLKTLILYGPRYMNVSLYFLMLNYLTYIFESSNSFISNSSQMLR